MLGPPLVEVGGLEFDLARHARLNIEIGGGGAEDASTGNGTAKKLRLVSQGG